MIFSLKERTAKLTEEARQSWVTEIKQFVKLIVLGIDPSVVVKGAGEDGGFYNVLHILRPAEQSGEPKVITGMTFHDESNNSVLADFGGGIKYILPLDQERFAKKLKEFITEKWEN